MLRDEDAVGILWCESHGGVPVPTFIYPFPIGSGPFLPTPTPIERAECPSEIFRSDEGVRRIRLDETMESIGAQKPGLRAVFQEVDPVVLPAAEQQVRTAFRNPETVDLSNVEAFAEVLDFSPAEATHTAVMGTDPIARAGNKRHSMVVGVDFRYLIGSEPMSDAGPLGTAIHGFPEVDTPHHHVIAIGRIHGNGQVIKALPTEIRTVHRPAQKVGQTVQGYIAGTTVDAVVHRMQSLCAGPGGHGPHFMGSGGRGSQGIAADHERIGQACGRAPASPPIHGPPQLSRALCGPPQRGVLRVRKQVRKEALQGAGEREAIVLTQPQPIGAGHQDLLRCA